MNNASTSPHDRAAAALRRLGHGVNIMTTALSALSAIDYQGLAQRVQHVRLCGSVVEPLIDWSVCPGATRHFANDAEAVSSLRRSRHMRELKAAVMAAQRVGLPAVINPMHRLFTLEVKPDTLRWVWSAMLLEFTEAAFPPEDFVFELTNEPGNYHNHSVVGGSYVAMLPALLHRIAASQPSRVCIVGGEMGRRLNQGPLPHGGGTGGAGGGSASSTNGDAYLARAAASNPSLEFVNSGPGLIRDATHVHRLGERYPVIATFHFYRPRNFTTQGSADVIHPQHRWLGTAADVADLAEQFDAVASGLGAASHGGASHGGASHDGASHGGGSHGSLPASLRTPVYLGEFGVNVGSIPHEEDGVAWLRAVRTLCEERGFGWAYWTYFQSAKAATTAAAASERLTQWDCSPHMAALFDGRGRAVQGGACPPRGHALGIGQALRGIGQPERGGEAFPGRGLASGSGGGSGSHAQLQLHGTGAATAPARPPVHGGAEWCDDRRPLHAQEVLQRASVSTVA